MSRLIVLSIALLVAAAEAPRAQTAPAPFCFRARPKPACSAFAVTNFGGYLVLGTDLTSDTPLREVADWGVMANVDARNAVGGSVFASLDRLGFGLGPSVRYRRWLSPTASLDVALGAPLLVTTSNLRSGSLFGLLRWSPNHWFALAARPELVRAPVFLGCGPTSCNIPVRSRARLSLGMELGSVPGLTLTAVGGLATALLAALIAGIGD
jgi:hypothetical protein